MPLRLQLIHHSVCEGGSGEGGGEGGVEVGEGGGWRVEVKCDSCGKATI